MKFLKGLDQRLVLLTGIIVLSALASLAMPDAGWACICGNDCDIIGDCCEDCGTGPDTWCSTNCPFDCCGKIENGTHVCGPSMCSPQLLSDSGLPIAEILVMVQSIDPLANVPEPSVQARQRLDEEAE